MRKPDSGCSGLSLAFEAQTVGLLTSVLTIFQPHTQLSCKRCTVYRSNRRKYEWEQLLILLIFWLSAVSAQESEKKNIHQHSSSSAEYPLMLTQALDQAVSNEKASKFCILGPRVISGISHIKPPTLANWNQDGLHQLSGVREGNPPRNSPLWIKRRSIYWLRLGHTENLNAGKILFTKDCVGDYYLIMAIIHSQDIAWGNTDAPSVKETWFNWFFC